MGDSIKYFSVPLAADRSTRAFFEAPDGTRLSYLVWGPGQDEVVLLLHGGMACALDWWQIATGLQPEWTVVALDQRGCGESDWDPPARYGIEPLVSDALALVARLDLARTAVVGHSLGAAAACLLAARRPDLVSRLVLEDGGPRDGAPRPRVFDRPIPAEFASRQEALEYLAETGLGGRGRASWVLETRFAERADGRLAWRADVAGAARWAAAGGEPLVLTLWDEVPRLACPTLVVRGEESRVFPADVPRRMAELNPLVSHVEIAGAGHGVHYERPDAFVDALRSFLSS
jgi:pimeloyl-ACP methyl ester carboxylesterase